MKRHALDELEKWKTTRNRKPLVLRGARQVGKTWLMKAFGAQSFRSVAYINFENNPRMRELFKGGFDIPRLLSALQIEARVRIDPHETLLVFDEVQEVPAALTSLKYFCEDAPEYAIVAAGSLLGVGLHAGASFPVGKVAFLDLHPMSYSEFLEAMGEAGLVGLLEAQDWPLVETFRDKYIDLLRNYYYVGGMPEAVQTFADTRDPGQVREVQARLLVAYEQDLSKHAPIETIPRIRMLWESVPGQLARENKKFFYGMMREGARSKDFELALRWLIDCGLIHRVDRVAKPQLPLASYTGNAFKLFMLDVGLLSAKSGLDARTLLEGNRIFGEFKGALTEQYVQQQLRAESGLTPYYWSAERGNAEVDFLIHSGMDVVPIEVKAEENLRSKSLRTFFEAFKPRLSIRTSMSGYRKQDWMINLPLYAIGRIGQVASAESAHE